MNTLEAVKNILKEMSNNVIFGYGLDYEAFEQRKILPEGFYLSWNGVKAKDKYIDSNVTNEESLTLYYKCPKKEPLEQVGRLNDTLITRYITDDNNIRRYFIYDSIVPIVDEELYIVFEVDLTL